MRFKRREEYISAVQFFPGVEIPGVIMRRPPGRDDRGKLFKEIAYVDTRAGLVPPDAGDYVVTNSDESRCVYKACHLLLMYEPCEGS